MSLSNGSSSNEDECISTRAVAVDYTVFYLTSIFLIFPVCVLVLYQGHRQWWQQCSTTTTAAKMGHSDIFIYHLVVMELVGLVGCTLCSVGIWSKKELFALGNFFWDFPWYGEAFFHVLTAVERYLAVVHPVTYLSSRSERGIKIRNICIGCVWLICFTLTGLQNAQIISVIVDYVLVFAALLVICFCSISVLYILNRPGPGEKTQSWGRSSKPKIKAFYIVMLILAAVALRYICSIAWIAFHVNPHQDCLVSSSIFWFSLPSTLVLLVLFLHRSGSFKFCISNASEEHSPA